MQHVTGKQILLGIVALLVLLVLGPVVVAYGWTMFLTPLTGTSPPAFWQLYGLLVTARLALGAARVGNIAPHQWLAEREHNRKVREIPSYAVEYYGYNLNKLGGGVVALLLLWVVLWIVS